MAQRDCLTAALNYARRGWAVFPLDGKLPFPGTGGFKDATTSRKQIRRWWRKWPYANVGIACNSTTGPLVVDIDGPEGEELAGVLKLPQTGEVRSSAGKRHLYFAPTGIRVPRKIRLKYRGKKFSLDVLGDGGYVVAPPSIHPDTQKPYKWVRERKLRKFPESLIHLINHQNNSTAAAPPLPKTLHEGNRDNLLTSLAGSMRRRGASEAAILAALREENELRVVPMLPDRDLKRIAKSVSRYPPAGIGEHYTDLGNARRFVAQHNDVVRSIPALGRKSWFVWNGKVWAPGDNGAVERMAKSTVRSLYTEALHVTNDDERENILKHAVKSESLNRIVAMIDLAKTEPEITLDPDKFDLDPWLFNVSNGTLDLRTGELRPHSKDDMVTKIANVEFDPDAICPRWESFLKSAMDGNERLVSYLQRAVGYSLTADVREHCLFFCYGGGRNGKSTFLDTLRALMGDYALEADFNTFLAKRGDGGARADLARMHGARFVKAVEADTNKPFDEAVLKHLTGGDRIVARYLYGNPFEFTPTHKIFLAANQKPAIREQTEAIWQRIRLIPFTQRFVGKKQDKTLKDALLLELPGILNWALKGCLLWQRDGLKDPRVVKAATEEYRDETDPLAEFFSERCKLDPEGWTPTAELYRVFVEWWVTTRGASGHKPMSPTVFGRALGERKELKYHKYKHMRGWKGVSIIMER